MIPVEEARNLTRYVRRQQSIVKSEAANIVETISILEGLDRSTWAIYKSLFPATAASGITYETFSISLILCILQFK